MIVKGSLRCQPDVASSVVENADSDSDMAALLLVVGVCCLVVVVWLLLAQITGAHLWAGVLKIGKRRMTVEDERTHSSDASASASASARGGDGGGRTWWQWLRGRGEEQQPLDNSSGTVTEAATTQARTQAEAQAQAQAEAQAQVQAQAKGQDKSEAGDKATQERETKTFAQRVRNAFTPLAKRQQLERQAQGNGGSPGEEGEEEEEKKPDPYLLYIEEKTGMTEDQVASAIRTTSVAGVAGFFFGGVMSISTAAKQYQIENQNTKYFSHRQMQVRIAATTDSGTWALVRRRENQAGLGMGSNQRPVCANALPFTQAHTCSHSQPLSWLCRVK